MKIDLIALTKRADVHGTTEGKVVYQALIDIVSENPSEEVFNISLEGIVATDASFPRESVLAVAKQFRDEGKWFCVSGKMTADMQFNWNCAAEFKGQPLVLWHEGRYSFLGPKISAGLQNIVDLVMSQLVVTTADVAETLDISTQNASSKLKKLSVSGYIARNERVAESGGIEFVYRAIA